MISVPALIRVVDMDYSVELITGTHIKELERGSHNLLEDVKQYETFFPLLLFYCIINWNAEPKPSPNTYPYGILHKMEKMSLRKCHKSKTKQTKTKTLVLLILAFLSRYYFKSVPKCNITVYVLKCILVLGADDQRSFLRF